MKKMFIFVILCIVVMLSGCQTFMIDWARNNGYILKTESPTPEPVQHQVLLHPIIPILDVENIDEAKIMEHVLLLGGSVEKYQILVEIYEREYILPVGKKFSNAKYADKTLEELKLEYLQLLGVTPTPPSTTTPTK